jgi:hypothetical protein
MLRTHCALISLTLVCTLGSGSDAQVRERVFRPAVTPTTSATPTRDATMTLLRPMAAPTNLTVTGTPATAALRWDAASGAIGYYVSRADAAGATVKLTANAIAATSFEDLSGGVKPGVAYTYSVTAVHANDGVGTAQVSFTPPAAAVPDSVRVEQRGSERALVWGSVPDAGSYQIIETWMQPVYRTVYSTVYSSDGQPRQVASTVVDYQSMTRTHFVAAPQSSLPLGAGVSGHRFEVGAAYPPSGVTAPRAQWRSTVAP